MFYMFALGILLSGLSFASDYSKLIPYPFHAVQNGSQNTVMFIDDGIAGLTERVNMIRRAKKSIVAEYFIYNTDTAGRIISRELVAAAKRGVKVRLLIDKSKAVFKFTEYYAKEMKDRGVEVRYYNPASLWRVSSIQFRTHRKLIAVDDLEAITGGRNIGDDYFDLSTEFNFDDSDLHVRGPIAKVMREAFERFFNHPSTERPEYPRFPSEKKVAAAKAFFRVTNDENNARQRMRTAGQSYLNLRSEHVCPTITFSTDAPGADFIERLDANFVDRFRFLRKTLADKISAVDKHITISSPYMIDSEQTEEMFHILAHNRAQIDLYTNSLGSTDATYVAANMYLGLESWRARGIRVFLNDGKWMGKNPQTPAAIQQAHFGTHSKVQVYETKAYSEVMVGTYNVDNRSNFYNAEMALFCKGNDDLMREVKSSIAVNMRNGLIVSKDGKTVTNRLGQVQNIYGADRAEILKMKVITFPSWLAKELL